MSRNVRICTFGRALSKESHQPSLSSSSSGAFCIVKYAKFLHADNEDSDQIARMRRLI